MEGEASYTLEPNVEVLAQAVDAIWVFFCQILVVLMQAGFASYEVGAIRETSTVSILLKNICDAAVSMVAWFMVGYTFAFGDDSLHVIGRSSFFFTGEPFTTTSDNSSLRLLECLYMWSFAATCTTIVSGAVADRIAVKAYIVYALLTSGLFYPILAHAVWSEEGWASSKREDPLFGCGVVDFAGSGVVHMLGGGIGLFITKRVKSRGGRFFDAKEWDWDGKRGTQLKNHTNQPQLNEAGFSPNDMAWMTLGCFLLWLGWYGFNCGSTLQISTTESQHAVARAAVNTTLAGGKCELQNPEPRGTFLRRSFSVYLTVYSWPTTLDLLPWFRAAWGCIFSLGIELAYHLWSPQYRRGDDIEDPLHIATFDVDARGGTERDELRRRENNLLSPRTLRKISRHSDEHRTSGFTWPFSTHKNLHGAAVNGILAGLVGITAGCATTSYHATIGVSFVSALLYHVSYRGFICLKIDDAVSAAAVHLVCGAWGLLAAGFTVLDSARTDAGYPPKDSCSGHGQGFANLLMMAVILVYSFLCTWMLWGVLRLFRLLEETESGCERAKAEDENIAELRERLTRQAAEENLENRRRIAEMEGLMKRLDELETTSKTTVNDTLNDLTNRMGDLESARRDDPAPSFGAPVSPAQTPYRRAAFAHTPEVDLSSDTPRRPAAASPSSPTSPSNESIFGQVKNLFGLKRR
ncbi:unnamed protein product [Scytosiphon promiscuus]